MNVLFELSNLLVLPFWFLMLLLPGWRWTRSIMRSPYVIVVPVILYAVLVLPHFGEIWPVVSRPALGDVTKLLSSPAGATISWVHFVAFDLFVGRWIYLDGKDQGVSFWLQAPALFLTLVLGPVGFLVYVILRFICLHLGTSLGEKR